MGDPAKAQILFDAAVAVEDLAGETTPEAEELLEAAIEESD